MKTLSLYIVALFFFPHFVFTQHSFQYEKPIASPLFISARTDSLPRILNEDSLVATKISVVDTTIRSPKFTVVAMLASGLLPGVGQLYNQSYWKAPIVWGFGYYFYSVYREQDKLYAEKRDAYAASLLADSLHIGNATLKDHRNFYRGQRDTFGWYLAIAYLINVLDAYVDAALFNFEVSPNLQPRNEIEMRASVRIPIQ